ncbi:replication protein A 70 kDa DNA-binding subunit B, partial [Tanacetum coccineum]
ILDAIENENVVNKTFKIYNVDHAICGLAACAVAKKYGYLNGYVNDLSVVKDNIILRVRILRTWMQEVYGKQHIKNMEFIIMDEHVSGKMCVQNGYHGTKVFTFDGSVAILKEEFSDVKEYSMRLFDKHDIEKSENTSTRISTASKNSTKESFVSKIPPRIIAELLDVAHGVKSIIVGTIIAIHEEESWWYIGCKGCKKKVIRSSDMVDLEVDVPKKTSSAKDDWWCTKCNIVPNIKTMFRLQIRIQDESGTMSLTLWNDEVQVVVDRSAYQLCDKYEKMGYRIIQYVPLLTV